MLKKHFPLFSLLVCGLFIGGCGSEPTPDKTASLPAVNDNVSIMAVPSTPAPETVSLTILSPSPEEVIQGSKVKVQLAIKGLSLGTPSDSHRSKEIADSPQGQCIHIVLDNNPSYAVYDVSAPIELPFELSPGAHLLRAFPSFSFNESLKEKGCFDSVVFYVGKQVVPSPIDLSLPLLTYSSPTGTVSNGGKQNVLLDFYLSNCTLAPRGNMVKVTIDDNIESLLAEWKPYYILGLSPGDHTVRLELLDQHHRPVAGPYNVVQTSIRVEP